MVIFRRSRQGHHGPDGRSHSPPCLSTIGTGEMAFLAWLYETRTEGFGASAAMGARTVLCADSRPGKARKGATRCDPLPRNEHRLTAELRPALPRRAAHLYRIYGIGGQRDCGETDGQEATDELE